MPATASSGAEPVKGGRNALFFILATVVLNSMGIGLIMPVMPSLLEDIGGVGLGEAAAWGGWLTTCYALMQFVMSPVLGNLSDAWGRRPVLLLSLAVMGLDYLIMALAPSLLWLFVARIIAGASSATFSTANACIADISTPEERAKRFGLTGAAFGLGFVIGPVIGGMLGEFGPRAPFWAAALLTFLNFGLGWLALPESHPPEKRRPFTWARGTLAGSFRMMRRNAGTGGLFLALLIYNFSHFVYPTVWAYFTTLRFGWSTAQIGLSLAVVGIGFIVVQGFLVGKIVSRFGAANTALAGLALDAVGLFLMAFATEGWMAYTLMPVMALAAIVSPAVQSLLTNRTPDNSQGELQGAVAALSSLAFIITPILMSQLFFFFTGPSAPVQFPGAPFLAAAAFSFFAILPMLHALRRG